MASRRKIQKPKDPQVAAAERRAAAFHEVGLQVAASTLPANADIDAERAEREHEARARRMDAFEALKEGMVKGAYDAARRLEKDITIARDEHDRGRNYDRVDDATRKEAGRLDAMLAARKRAEDALAMIGARDAYLLHELIAPGVQTKLSCASWRGIVAYVTGEENPHGQAAAVRGACANLAAAYEKMMERAA
jgi:hypothetical protein